LSSLSPRSYFIREGTTRQRHELTRGFRNHPGTLGQFIKKKSPENRRKS